MKVRASVKRICEKCRVIKRHGRVMVIATSETQAAPGLRMIGGTTALVGFSYRQGSLLTIAMD